MAKKDEENQEPENKGTLKKEKTEFSKKDKGEEEKPSFRSLLPGGEKPSTKSSKESSLPGSEDEALVDENIQEICKDIIGIPFDIWHQLNPKVNPLSELEKKHISQPLARIAIKYNVAEYMKDELVLCAFLGFAIYKRAKVKKDDVDHSGKKEKGKDDLSKESHPG